MELIEQHIPFNGGSRTICKSDNRLDDDDFSQILLRIFFHVIGGTRVKRHKALK